MSIASEEMENLLYLFLLVYPATTAERIYAYWPKHKVLKEYPQPEKAELVKLVAHIKTEISYMTTYDPD